MRIRSVLVATVLPWTLAAAVGCSKNEEATRACGASGSSEACSACCTSNGASGYKYSSGAACACLGGDAKKGAAVASVAASAGAVSFAGTYRSNWGSTVFTETGDRVTASYARGTMTCKASGANLDCDWREGAAFGKAKLVRQPDGSIRGTWGSDTSATNGGNWNFLP